MSISEKALQNGVDIAYQPIVEYPINIQTGKEKGIKFVEWLAPGVAKVSGKDFGVCFVKSGFCTALRYRKVERTENGLIKADSELMNVDGSLLSGSDAQDAKDAGGGCYAVRKNKLWALFRIADRSQVTEFCYDDIGAYSEGSFVVTKSKVKTLIDINGRQLLPQYYEVCEPFHEDMAIVGSSRNLCYIDRSGRTVFSGACKGSRGFCNGYAVFFDALGKAGAINKNGQIVVTPMFLFMKNASFDKFVVSNDGKYQPDGVTFRGKNYGLIAAGGSMLLPMQYDAIDILPDGGYRYGHAVSWSVSEANGYRVHQVLVSALADASGREILPEEYVEIGSVSEGMRAFKSHKNATLTFGYMSDDGSSRFEIASIGASQNVGLYHELLLEKLSQRLKPFENGTAQVAVAMGEKNVGIFKKKIVRLAEKTGWYRIDRSGSRVASEGETNKKPFDLKTCTALPFHRLCTEFRNSMMYRSTNIYGYVATHEFDGMTEAVLGDGFGIVDMDGNLICGSYTGSNTPSSAVIISAVNRVRPHALIHPLTRVADNVWLGVKNGEEKIIFSEFESPTWFSSGVGPYRAPNGLWGYMDWHGNTVIEPQYTEASGFEDGYAFAVKGADSVVVLYRGEQVRVRG